MRETLVGLLVFSGILVGYYHLKKMGYSYTPISRDQLKSSTAPRTNVEVNYDEQTHYPVRSRKDSRKGSRTSVKAKSSEVRASFASRSKSGITQKETSSENAAREDEGLGDSADTAGVNLALWESSRRQSLEMPVQTQDSLRIFIQCMELKAKGAEPIAEQECRSLIGKKQGPRPAEQR